MKKVFKFTETRSWYFELDVDDGAQVEEHWRHWLEPRVLIII